MNKSFLGTWKASALVAFIWLVAMLLNVGSMALSYHTALSYARVSDLSGLPMDFVGVGGLYLVLTLMNASLVGWYAMKAVSRFRNGQDN